MSCLLTMSLEHHQRIHGTAVCPGHQQLPVTFVLCYIVDAALFICSQERCGSRVMSWV
jgi:hypothetical protein